MLQSVTKTLLIVMVTEILDENCKQIAFVSACFLLKRKLNEVFVCL